MKCGQVRQPGSWVRAAEAKMLFLEKDQAGLGIWAWPLPNSHQPRIQSGSAVKPLPPARHRYRLWSKEEMNMRH